MKMLWVQPMRDNIIIMELMICGCACMHMENMKAHDTAQKEMATRKKELESFK
jgi:hypothetical protein